MSIWLRFGQVGWLQYQFSTMPRRGRGKPKPQGKGKVGAGSNQVRAIPVLPVSTPACGNARDPRRKVTVAHVATSRVLSFSPVSATTTACSRLVVYGGDFFVPNEMSTEYDEFRIRDVSVHALISPSATEASGVMVYIAPDLNTVAPTTVAYLLKMEGARVASSTQPRYSGPVFLSSVKPRVETTQDSGIGLERPWLSVGTAYDKGHNSFVLGLTGFNFVVGTSVSIQVLISATLELRGLQ